MPQGESSPDETERLAALRWYAVTGTPPEEAFDRITRLAARWLNAPIALIALVDEGRQWFKSCFGMDRGEIAREASFCAHNLKNDRVMVIPDATDDDRFADNPLVTGAPGIRFYAGAPQITSDGHHLGSLCVLDTVPRPEGMTRDERETLRELAAVVMDELELRATRRHREEMLESITDAFFAVDTAWQFTYVNQAGRGATPASPRGPARQERVGRVPWGR